MDWINITEQLPVLRTKILIVYFKGKEKVITEGYLTDTLETLKNTTIPIDVLKSKGYGLTFFDYADRQIQALNAKNSKNQVTFWTVLPILP